MSAADHPLQPDSSTGELLPLERRLLAAWPISRWKSHTAVIAVSGGSDSVALARALSAVARHHHLPASRLLLAHFNHHWRGDASDGDEQFVRQLAQQLGLAVRVGHASPHASASGLGREGVARRDRYAFLKQVASEASARYVVTAHTADDQVETILFRMLRGTGVEGLAGIRRVRRFAPHVALIRPLLEIHRCDLQEYLAALGQSWREDQSNQWLGPTRNQLRLEWLPRLRESLNPHVDQALLRLAADARETLQLLRRAVRRAWPRCVAEESVDGFRLHRDRLNALSPVMRRGLLRYAWRRRGWPIRDMSRARWQELAALAAAAPSRRHFPGRVLVSVCEQWITARRELS